MANHFASFRGKFPIISLIFSTCSCLTKFNLIRSILHDKTHQWHSTQTSGTKGYHDCGIEIRAGDSSSSCELFAVEWRDNDIKERVQTFNFISHRIFRELRCVQSSLLSSIFVLCNFLVALCYSFPVFVPTFVLVPRQTVSFYQRSSGGEYVRRIRLFSGRRVFPYRGINDGSASCSTSAMKVNVSRKVPCEPHRRRARDLFARDRAEQCACCFTCVRASMVHGRVHVPKGPTRLCDINTPVLSSRVFERSERT